MSDAADFKKHADAAIDEFMSIARIPPMTLRDYFAAAALASDKSPTNSYSFADTAKWCYDQADAMLAARK